MLGVAGTVVLVGLAATTAVPAHAAFPGEPGRILFVEDVPTASGPQTTIRSMQPDGTDVRTVVAGAWRPATSPDGRMVAYVDYVADLPQVFVVGADGSGARQVTRFAYGGDVPDWSPDGARLVVARYDDDSYMLTSLWTLRATDGGDARQVVAATDASGRPSFAWDPAWSVGDRIAFSGLAHGPAGTEDVLFTVRPDGTDATRLTAGTGAFAPDWSPDGSELVFERSHGMSASTLQVIAANGTGERRLVDVAGWPHDPVWSPDGQHVAFWVAGDPPADGLHVVGADGRGLRRVRAGASAPSWQPVAGPMSDPAQVTRHAGADRIATAIAISRAGFPDDRSASTVVLARADAFPDALAGVPLAVARGGPLLLTPGAGLDPRVAREVQRVLASEGTVVLLGGHAALSSTVERDVEALGVASDRLAGIDRYATAAAIASELEPHGPVFVATGLDFPDALAAGAAAAHVGGVVVLSAGTDLPDPTRVFLRTTTSQVYAVGGQAATAVPTATRLVGTDRYVTARRVAAVVFDAPPAVALASGVTFPDGLAGGAHAGARGLPLLLTAPDALPRATADHLAATRSVLHAHVYGGPSAIRYGVTAAVGELLADR